MRAVEISRLKTALMLPLASPSPTIAYGEDVRSEMKGLEIKRRRPSYFLAARTMAALRSLKLASLFSVVVSQPVGGGVGIGLESASTRSFRPYLSIRLDFEVALDGEAGSEGRLVG